MPRPRRIGHGRRCTRCNGRNAVQRKLLEHAVAGQVGDHATDLIGSQPTADAGEVGNQTGQRTGAVHQVGERDLLRRQAQVTGLAVIRGPQHRVGHTAGTDQLGLFNAGTQNRAGLGRVDPFRDRRPQSWVSRPRRLPRGSTSQRLPHTDPGFDDRHAMTPKYHAQRRGRRAPAYPGRSVGGPGTRMRVSCRQLFPAASKLPEILSYAATFLPVGAARVCTRRGRRGLPRAALPPRRSRKPYG